MMEQGSLISSSPEPVLRHAKRQLPSTGCMYIILIPCSVFVSKWKTRQDLWEAILSVQSKRVYIYNEPDAITMPNSNENLRDIRKSMIENYDKLSLMFSVYILLSVRPLRHLRSLIMRHEPGSPPPRHICCYGLPVLSSLQPLVQRRRLQKVTPRRATHP